MDAARWDRLSGLLDRLLDGEDQEAVFAGVEDEDLRRELAEMWRHHALAEQDGFLSGSLTFQVLPVFERGQRLLNRFEIIRALGSGGMGEVYLALDTLSGDEVALKTVARLLSPSSSIRRQILTEVRNAKRVTHANVCRIYEVFEDGSTVFFTMEYVEGRLLSEALEDPEVRKRGKTIALQLARGLQAAHEKNVIHGDFKVGNVMLTGSGTGIRAVIMDFGLARALETVATTAGAGLSVRAGTVDYMAPELYAMVAPNEQTDIYAFGKVGRQLAPGLASLWEACVRDDPRKRPGLVELIEKLESVSPSRRYLMWGLGTAGTGWVLWRNLNPPPNVVPVLPGGSKLLVNGMSITGEIPGVQALRGLLVTGLRQSPRIRTVTDEDLIRSTGVIRSPLDPQLLEKLAGQFKAEYWVDSTVTQNGGRYSFRLQLRRAGVAAPLSEVALRDLPNLGKAATEAALWVRRSAGESDTSIRANPAAAMQYTSTVPEALDKYFSAMELYAQVKMQDAIPLFREAVTLDPRFAQAHYMLGMTLNGGASNDEAFREIATARDLSAGLPERERTRILAGYAAISLDAEQAVILARKTVSYDQEDPRSYRALAQYMVHAGAISAAIEYSERAVVLAKGEDLFQSELIHNLAEAGRFEDALHVYSEVVKRGVKSPFVHRGGSLALMGLERYSDARSALAFQPADNEAPLWLLKVRVLEGNLEVAIAEAREYLLSAKTSVTRFSAVEYLCGLSYILGRTEEARSYLQKAELSQTPAAAKQWVVFAFWAARLGDSANLMKAVSVLDAMADKFGNQFLRGLSDFGRGLQQWKAGSASEAERLLLAGIGQAYNIWGELSLADMYLASGKSDLAANYFAKFESHKGSVFRRHLTGVIVDSWASHAKALLALGDNEKAAMYAKKVLQHWGSRNSGAPSVRVASEVVGGVKIQKR